MRSFLSSRVLALAFLATFGLSACAPLITQSPNEGLRPVNVKDAEGASRLLLDGHDVVAYFTEGKHRLGSAAHQSTYKGISLRFASAQHKDLFDKSPTAYLPQFGGFCANGIAYGIPWGGDADTWRIVEGKLYIFGGIASKKGFELDLPGNLKLAHQLWDNEVGGSNAFIQRTKRMIMRVPHYKSGDVVAAEVAAKEKAK
jgi:YHS domain-containing protein